MTAHHDKMLLPIESPTSGKAVSRLLFADVPTCHCFFMFLKNCNTRVRGFFETHTLLGVSGRTVARRWIPGSGTPVLRSTRGNCAPNCAPLLSVELQNPLGT